ncbi:MAG: hypothetical protein IT512_00350 [Rhodocyclaceae bacterium]|nr:hypothetical protein [Rhodocyclaceae bacterium]
MAEKALTARDAKRDISAELVQSMRDLILHIVIIAFSRNVRNHDARRENGRSPEGDNAGAIVKELIKHHFPSLSRS